MQKPCFKCRALLPLGEFYKHPRMADGHLNKCKLCTRLDTIANRVAKLEFYRQYDRSRPKRKSSKGSQGSLHWKRFDLKYPQKAKAHAATASAIRSGVLVRQPCEVCQHEPAEAHHDDYGKPLDVRWLCTKHHAEHHKCERESRRKSAGAAACAN